MSLDPKNAIAYSRSCGCLGEQARPCARTPTTTRPSNTIPRDPDRYALRAQFYKNGGEWDRALTDHNEAIGLEPDVASRYANRGDVFYEKSDYYCAMADYDKAISLNPRYADAYNARAEVWRTRRELDRAMTEIRKRCACSRRILPTSSRSPTSSTRRRHRSGAGDLRPGARPQSGQRHHVGNRGLIYAVGEYDRAMADFNEAIRLDPKLNRTYFRSRRPVAAERRPGPGARRPRSSDPAQSERWIGNSIAATRCAIKANSRRRLPITKSVQARAGDIPRPDQSRPDL